jgi:hypothetical protein
MPRERPTVVTIFAVINLIFGSLGLLGILATLVVLLVASILGDAPPPATTGGGTAAAGAAPAGGAGVPMAPPAAGRGGSPVVGMGGEKPAPRLPLGVTFYRIFSLILGVVSTVALFFSGIGLLKMQAWGRNLAIFYAILSITVSVVGLVIQLVYVNAALARYYEEAAKVAGAATPPAPSFLAGNLFAIITAAVGITYPGALLGVMLLPGVREAFSGSKATKGLRRGREDDEDDEDEEEEDEPRPRRKRRRRVEDDD